MTSELQHRFGLTAAEVCHVIREVNLRRARAIKEAKELRLRRSQITKAALLSIFCRWPEATVEDIENGFRLAYETITSRRRLN